MQDKRVKLFQTGMLVLNCIAVMFICAFIATTTEGIRRQYSARQFLDGVSAIPWQPWRNTMVCLLLLIFIMISFVLRGRVLYNRPKLLYGSFVFDFAASFAIVYVLDFNYNGILLFVFANMVAYTNVNRVRFVFMALAMVSYLFADYELVSINYPLYSIRDYISQYDSVLQSYLFSLYNVMISLNIMLFILYCIFVIFRQQGTIEEVNELYGKLSAANADLETANEQLRHYASITEKMGETKERNRMAREIHDTLGHTLTGISAGIDACITTLEQSPKQTRKHLELISRVTREGIIDVRRSVNKLRIDALERLPLEHAITKMITDMGDVTDAKIYFVNRIGSLHFSEDEENAIYRVIQESLTNAVRHGKASIIRVELQLAEQGILLTVEDNGIGCSQITSGFGTRHIKERIEMLGGKVTFDGSDGFKVRGEIPIRWGGKE